MVSTEYARAAFEIANEHDNLGSFYDDFRVLRRAIRDNSDLYTVMKSPVIKKAEKKQIINKITEGMEQDLRNFLMVVVDNNRFELIVDIYFEFKNLFLVEKNVMTVEVISPKELSPSDFDKVKDKLGNAYKGKTIRLKNVVEPSLISGIKLKFDGESIDLSIKNEIESLKACI